MKQILLLGGLALALMLVVLFTPACQSQIATVPTPVPTFTPVPEANVAFMSNAFPPPIPDLPQHREAWLITDCMGCHSETLGEAPAVVHEGLPETLLEVNCRTCHVTIAGESGSTAAAIK
ncbi:MAG: multiheme c-type cytochrome [Chloroflexota bacterium]